MMERTVCAAIVTYNRKELLRELLFALKEQSYRLRAVVLVNNNSSDGTDELLRDIGFTGEAAADTLCRSAWNGIDTYYYRSSRNTGGSGGFAKAFEYARDLPYDCIWAMDDDVLPERDCLENMMKYLDGEARACIPCRGDGNFRDYAIQKYDLTDPFLFRPNRCKRETVFFDEIQTPYVYVEDMAFEGPLMDRQLVREIGIPNKEYFIFFDDTEYAQRMLRVTKIRYVVGAKLHKQIIPAANSKWGWRTYYNLRNSVFFWERYGKNAGVRYVRPFLKAADLVGRAICKGRWRRIKWILRAYLDGKKGNMGKTYEPAELYSE